MATKDKMWDVGEFPKEPTVKCPECDRQFDLSDNDDANEYYYGHDCEVE